MNNAGLPGTGLGGLFYLLLAFAMPVVEAVQTVRGRSSRARWRRVGAQFALACGIVVVTVASMVALGRLVDLPRPLGLDGPGLAFAPVLVGVAVLGVLLVLIRVWARLDRSSPPPPGRHRRTAALATLTDRST